MPAPDYTEFADHAEMTRCAAPFRAAKAMLDGIIAVMGEIRCEAAKEMADTLIDLQGEMTAFVTLSKYDAGLDSDDEAKELIEAIWWPPMQQSAPDFSRLEREKAERMACSATVAAKAVNGAIHNTGIT